MVGSRTAQSLLDFFRNLGRPLFLRRAFNSFVVLVVRLCNNRRVFPRSFFSRKIIHFSLFFLWKTSARNLNVIVMGWERTLEQEEASTA